MLTLLTAETLNAENLLRSAYAREVKQGRVLYEQGAATVQQADARSAQIEVVESPEIAHTVQARVAGTQVALTCTCQWQNYWTLCKHRVAAVLALDDYLRAHPPSAWKAVLAEAVRPPARKPPATTQKLIVFSLQRQGDAWAVLPYGIATKYFAPTDLDDPDAIARAVLEGGLADQAAFIRQRISPQQYRAATPDDIAAASLAVAPTNSTFDYGRGHVLATASEALLSFLPGCIVFYGDAKTPFKQLVEIPEQPASIELSIEEKAGALRLSPTVTVDGRSVRLTSRKAQIVLRNPLWLLLDHNTLVQVAEASNSLTTLLDYPDLSVPAEEREEFFDQYLLPLAETMPVRGKGLQWEQLEAEPVPRLYLGEQAGELVAQLRFGYGEHELPYDKALQATATIRKAATLTLVRITRRTEAEQGIYQSLTSHGLKRGVEAGSFQLRKGVDTADFLLHHVPRLVENGFEIYGEDAIASARVNRNRPTMSFRVSSGINWFDIGPTVRYGDTEVPLKELRRAVRKRERYIKLADGSIGAIPPEWIERYRHLFALAEETDDGLRLAQHHLTLIDQLLGEADRAEADPEFERRRARLRSFETIEQHPLPQSFVGELRPYQQAGFDWLHFLHEYGFGGCLADDMGTGKTVVTLAFLQSLRENGHATAPDMLVLPRSLIFNWQREAAQFTPNLRVGVYADQSRVRDTSAFEGLDLVLTTYGVMRRDIEVLRQHTFHYLVLDESQAIKNPLGETSKAARLLSGEHRLCLTGTPVENSTVELWSQFAFLNPGLLGNLDYFREEFVTPIERKQNQESATFLRKMVFPFILRRTKDQVAPDLPPRTERVLVSEMEPAQRRLYIEKRDYYRDLLAGLIEGEGLQNARMKILEGLLRLRQICNHPRLVDPEFGGESAKFEQLLETLETLKAEGHKALVFSQFVQMLTIVREALDAQGIRYAYLDGQTKQRQREVDRFQNDPTLPFFLISLKAGGVGLNLTAADYVIHIDPWWNPAAEQQASDRTHRIGQDKPVFVYKLVTKDSVEEKILQLQDQKRLLADQLISSEGGVFKSLTAEDVQVLFT